MDVKMTRAQFKAYQRLLKVVPLTIDNSMDSVEVEITDEAEGWEEVDSYPACRTEWDDLDVDTELLEAWTGLCEAYLRSANLGAEMAAADAYTRRAEQGFCNYSPPRFARERKPRASVNI